MLTNLNITSSVGLTTQEMTDYKKPKLPQANLQKTQETRTDGCFYLLVALLLKLPDLKPECKIRDAAHPLNGAKTLSGGARFAISREQSNRSSYAWASESVRSKPAPTLRSPAPRGPARLNGVSDPLCGWGLRSA